MVTSANNVTLHSSPYNIHIAQIFGRGKLWQISHQKLSASKTLANSCLFAFFIYVMRDC